MNDPGPALLVDIGNSRIKWGFGCPGRVEAGEPFSNRIEDISRHCLRLWGDSPRPLRVMAANVAGVEVAGFLINWVQQQWGLTVDFVRSKRQGFGVTSGYEEPEKLGVDRWVALVGARHACQGPVCVADCGTAITLDVLDAEGIHQGGLIAPGLHLMRQSLAAGTHALPSAAGEGTGGLARATTPAIANGTLWAAAGLIEKTWRNTSQKLGSAPRLLLTGGDAPVIATLLEIPYDLTPNLVLEGLLVMAGGDL